MLIRMQISSSPLQHALPVAGLVGVMVVAVAAFCAQAGRVFYSDGVFFVDGDCYNRMARVERVAAAPWAPLRVHDFENHPVGVTPHTTAPLDYAILAVAAVVGPASGPNALAVAGAVISPVLGLALLAFLWWWAGRLDLPWRAGMLLLLAASPMTAHAFALGRPDHQSLILLLVGVALAAEAALWRGGGAGWRYTAAAAWGFALWVSLFEPLILLAVVGLARVFRPAAPARPLDRRPLALFGAIVFFGFLWDGWRAGAVDPSFGRWAATIGELGRGSWQAGVEWTGGFLFVVPLFLLVRGLRNGDPLLRLWGVLLLATAGLAIWHVRWGYFFVLVLALAMPWALAGLRRWWVAVPIAVACFWPVAAAWDRTLDPEGSAVRAAREQLADDVLLREVSAVLRGMPRGGALAPWWLSPAVAWWSGQPCLGGTSHQSLPGTMDGVRFYLATDPAEAEAVLAARKVRYVIAYEPDRVLGNAAQLTGAATIPSGTMAEVLYRQPAQAPPFLRSVFANRFFRLYEVVSADDNHEDKLPASGLRTPDEERDAAREQDLR